MKHVLSFRRIFLLLVVLVSTSLAYPQPEPDFWQQTNGPFGGTINALALNSNGDIFAGTEGGAVFRSSDRGDNWSQIDNGLASTSVASLAISINDVIFADIQWKTIRGRAQS